MFPAPSHYNFLAPNSLINSIILNTSASNKDCCKEIRYPLTRIVSFKELSMANVIQIDTVIQLLIEKGIFAEGEFFIKLKQVQGEWEGKKASKV